jgi:methyl-accepting chemotaxis protein
MLRDTLLNAKTSTKLYTLFACILGLFVGAVFFVFLPYYEQDLIKTRRASLADTLDLGSSLLAEYESRIQKGEFTPEEGHKRASMRLHAMRYGNGE